MFFFCFPLSLLIVLISQKPLDFNVEIATIGFINVIAALFFGRAVKIALSQSIFLFPLVSTVAVFLSALFLDEWHFLDPRSNSGLITLFGLLATLLAMFFLGTSKRYSHTIRRRWIFAAIVYVLIGGAVNFLIKYFAVREVAEHNYLFSWYSGAFLGALLSLVKGRSWTIWIDREKLFFYSLLGLTTVGAMWIFYWLLLIIPATLFFPLHSFFFVLGVVLIGLFVFQEKRGFGWIDWLGMGLGLIGSVMLIVGIYFR